MIRIYGRDNCSFCNKAKAFAKMKDMHFEYDDDPETLKWAVEHSGMKTVPIIYFDHEEWDTGMNLIGGFDDFVDWYIDRKENSL